MAVGGILDHAIYSLLWLIIKLRFIEVYKQRDFEQIWIGLCQDDPGAKGAIRSYLRDYVENSQTTRPVLGDKESEVIQTITTTKTVIEHWKTLVVEADNTILRVLRHKDPDNRGLWKLRWEQGESSDRPVGNISNVRDFVAFGF